MRRSLAMAGAAAAAAGVAIGVIGLEGCVGHGLAGVADMNGSTARARAPGIDPGARGPGGMYVEESGIPGSPAIVFIHGAGQSGRDWRGHMARLGGFHCLAPDLPGFGRSNHLAPASNERDRRPRRRAHRDARPGRRASVVGISSAGIVIHALLDRHPDRVERAVIDGSPPLRRAARRPLAHAPVPDRAVALHPHPSGPGPVP